jgi:hypothetical protein
MQEADKPETFRWAGHSHVFRSGAGARTIPDWVRALRGRLDYFGFGHPWDAGDLELIRSIEGNPEALEAYFVPGTAGGDALRVERFERWKRECEGFLCGIDLETPKIRYGHLWWLDWQPLHPPWHDYDQPWGAWEGAGRIGPPPPFARRMPAEVVREQVADGGVKKVEDAAKVPERNGSRKHKKRGPDIAVKSRFARPISCSRAIFSWFHFPVFS